MTDDERLRAELVAAARRFADGVESGTIPLPRHDHQAHVEELRRRARGPLLWRIIGPVFGALNLAAGVAVFAWNISGRPELPGPGGAWSVVFSLAGATAIMSGAWALRVWWRAWTR